MQLFKILAMHCMPTFNPEPQLDKVFTAAKLEILFSEIGFMTLVS